MIHERFTHRLQILVYKAVRESLDPSKYTLSLIFSQEQEVGPEEFDSLLDAENLIPEDPTHSFAFTVLSKKNCHASNDFDIEGWVTEVEAKVFKS